MPSDDERYVDFMLERAKALATAARYLWPIPNRGLAKRLHRVRVPTLLVWGESDGLVPPSYGRDFQSLLQNAELRTVASSAHMVPVEQPAELADLIERFLGATG